MKFKNSYKNIDKKQKKYVTYLQLLSAPGSITKTTEWVYGR